MRTVDQLVQEVDELIQDLQLPLSPEEVAFGWKVESQRATLNLLSEIRATLVNGQPLKDLSLGRGLDHWGVEAGPMLERACVLSNHLRSYREGK